MLIREEFSLPLVEEVLKQNVTTVIVGTTSHEERCKRVKELFANTQARIISVEYNHDDGVFSLSVLNESIPSTTTRTTTAQFASVLGNRINGFSKNILIDLTSLQHAVIIVLLNIICKSLKPAHLFAAYVKPQRYINKDNLGHYALSARVSEPAGIPGLIRKRQDKEIVIPFLGFEGNRLQNFIDNDNMTYDAIVPVIGFPSEDPSWQFDALKNCMHVLETAGPDSVIRKCKSNSIYDAIATLEEIRDLYPDNNFVLLPLGIRPHTAACSLWAAKYRNVPILYDYAVEADERSEGVGDAMVFHLSRFL